MGICGLNLNESPPEDDTVPWVMLERDKKPICRTRCLNLPFLPPMLWKILDFQPKARYIKLDLPICQLHPEPLRSSQRREWGNFTKWMQTHEMVGIVKFKTYEFYILPPHQGQDLPHVDVCYQMKNAHSITDGQGVQTLGGNPIEPKSLSCANPRTKNAEAPKHNDNFHTSNYTRTDANSLLCDSIGDATSQSRPAEHLEDRGQKIHLNTNPSYLKTLGQAHAWTFGAIAELVDNSRDARATRLDICVDSLYLKQAGKQVPVLSILDDGHGMLYSEMVRMLSLGHRQPDEDDPNHIGRFGVGFKV